MNFSFYILGTPSGYNQYPADNNTTIFQEFAQQHNTTESQLTIKRNGQLVYYLYMKKLQEKSSNFLGFCLVFNGVYCRNPKKLTELFDRAFYDTQLKGEYLKYDKGKTNYIIVRFGDKPLEIERLRNFFKLNLDNDFTKDFVNLPPAFKFGTGSKSISIKENDIDILSAIAEYEVVHITNNDKSQSELERTQKMLTKLYAENDKLKEKNYILNAKKKQYSVVIVLCFILVGCAIGLIAFNKNLQNKDSQIASLTKDKNEKIIEIQNLNSNIAQLQLAKEQLKNEKTKLTIYASELTIKNDELTDINDQLYSEIIDKNSIISNLKSENNKYRSENSVLQSKNRNLQYDVDKYKKYVPVTYKAIYKAEYYYKYRCNESYKETNCYTSSGGTTEVYTISNGYGLTEYGWVKMSYWSKY